MAPQSPPPTGRSKRRPISPPSSYMTSTASVAATVALLQACLLATWGGRGAWGFVSPGSPQSVRIRPLLPTAAMMPTTMTRTDFRRRHRHHRLGVSLAPTDEEKLEGAADALSLHDEGNDDANGGIGGGLNATFSAVDDTEERRMERVRMNDDAAEVTELTNLLGRDARELEALILTSVPVSYDPEEGMVQADCVPDYASFVDECASSSSPPASSSIDPGAAAVLVPAEQLLEFPAFIEFLYSKDENGRTLADKIVNVSLLAVCFGYAFFTVANIDRGMTRGWTPAEIGMRIPLDTWASYENSLSEKPIATKTIINIVIYLLGDWLSQTLFQNKNILDFDAGRTLKNGFVGMCFGPAVHEYYEFSDSILPVDGVTLGVTNRLFKILMDQTFYLSVKCSIYIMALGVLNGESVENSFTNVKNRIKPIMFTAWKFWPLVHCVTYGLIPARHRILWVNSVDLVWNAILATKARDDGDDEDNESGEGTENGSGEAMEGGAFLSLKANGGADSDAVVIAIAATAAVGTEVKVVSKGIEDAGDHVLAKIGDELAEKFHVDSPGNQSELKNSEVDAVSVEGASENGVQNAANATIALASAKGVKDDGNSNVKNKDGSGVEGEKEEESDVYVPGAQFVFSDGDAVSIEESSPTSPSSVTSPVLENSKAIETA